MRRKRIFADCSRQFVRAGLIAPFFLAGCIERTVSGGIASYRFAWWAMAGLAAAGAASVWAARLVPVRTDGSYRFTPRIRWALVSVGVVAMFLTTVMYCNGVTVSADEFHESNGFFGQKRHRVKFGDLRGVALVKEESGIGRSRRTNFYFLCLKKDGNSEKVPLSGTCMQAALPEIVAGMKARGIPITDKTQE